VSDTEKIHKRVEAALPGLDVVIGWGAAYDPLRTTPVFTRKAEEIARLVWSPFCTQNLAGYLVKEPAVKSSDPAKKIGILVKGCDSRSLVALIQEKFITRDQIHIFGISCTGTIDWRKVMNMAPLADIKKTRVEGERLMVEDATGSHEFKLEEVLLRKCLKCEHPNPVIYDELITDPVSPRVVSKAADKDIDALEAKSLEERLAFWQAELGKCMRCYACRNACPLCVCQDKCIAESREPRWLPQYMHMSEKYLFHFIHALHLAGRCTGCGECERACPMEIPVTLIKEKLNQITREILVYEAGLDPEAVPPLLTYDPSDTGL
jgi:formate dehydrogenase (coenzyme F420) beta subunit